MLVLSRKIGERIVINDNVVVTVLEIHGNQIRIGVEAPQSVPIWRGELCGHEREVIAPRRHGRAKELV